MTGDRSIVAAADDRRAARQSSGRWRWSNWSLTHKLPLFTASVVVLAVATSLALTYDALKRARIESTYDRLNRLARQIGLSSEQTMRVRAGLYRQVATDSAVRAALRAAERGAIPREGSPVARAASEALLRLRTPPDSSLPIELWTTDGRRVVHVGEDVRDDSLHALRPELRALNGRPVTEIPTGRAGSDSLQYGAFYASGRRVLFWTIVPVMEDGRRVGHLAQQRGFRSTPQAQEMMKELLGNDASLNVHNITDQFWSDYAGEAIAPLAGVDTLTGDYIGERAGVGKVIASEARVRGTPWIFSLEAPVSAVLAEPRATLRRLALISFLIAVSGVIATWVVSRRITSPLVALTSVSDAIARGDYDTRMPHHSGEWTKNEVARLSSTFNRMAGEIAATHSQLEQQVEEALAVSQELELANEELQSISAEARDARDAAQKANRAKSDFLAVMSHELRTPLNAIGGYTDILQLGIYGEVNHKQEDALRRITRSQQTLLSLINDVLNFAKLDAGQVHFRIADVPLALALTGAEPMIAPQLQAKRLSYRLTPFDETLSVRADPDKLQQILLNLLSNAIKFTAPEGTITVSCDTQDEWVRIHVRDSGVGIPAERHESIFDPFVQVDRAPNRPHEGVGLGLSISRDLARGMGGTLSVRSRPGEGATFTLRLRLGGQGGVA
ncbi:MAG TPA: HAMP domain-containing sensor histidine kinase [Gemmatimonadaceae bacterium]|nr:HAMP domain-containing sensor histidine kinase [Gemmatimonadaceae bacterium]